MKLALQQPQTLSRYHLEHLNFADSNAVNMAAAAIRYVHDKAVLARSRNITPCQRSAGKFDIVQRCGGSLIWVSCAKCEILPVLLDEAADVIEGHAGSAPTTLPKTQAEHLHSFLNHVSQPCGLVGRAVSRNGMRNCTGRRCRTFWRREKMYALLSGLT